MPRGFLLVGRNAGRVLRCSRTVRARELWQNRVIRRGICYGSEKDSYLGSTRSEGAIKLACWCTPGLWPKGTLNAIPARHVMLARSGTFSGEHLQSMRMSMIMALTYVWHSSCRYDVGGRLPPLPMIHGRSDVFRHPWPRAGSSFAARANT